MGSKQNDDSPRSDIIIFLIVWGIAAVSLLLVFNCVLRKCRTLPQSIGNEDGQGQEEGTKSQEMSSDKRRTIFEKMLHTKRVSINDTSRSVSTSCSDEGGYSSDETEKTHQQEEKKIADVPDLCALNVPDFCAHNVRDDEASCLICMCEYEDGEEVTSGNLCNHIFHKKCILDWLEKHDFCPICRQSMMTSDELKVAASLLGFIAKSSKQGTTNESAIEHDTPDLESGQGNED